MVVAQAATSLPQSCTASAHGCPDRNGELFLTSSQAQGGSNSPESDSCSLLGESNIEETCQTNGLCSLRHLSILLPHWNFAGGCPGCFPACLRENNNARVLAGGTGAQAPAGPQPVLQVRNAGVHHKRLDLSLAVGQGLSGIERRAVPPKWLARRKKGLYLHLAIWATHLGLAKKRRANNFGAIF